MSSTGALSLILIRGPEVIPCTPRPKGGDLRSRGLIDVNGLAWSETPLQGKNLVTHLVVDGLSKY